MVHLKVFCEKYLHALSRCFSSSKPKAKASDGLVKTSRQRWMTLRSFVSESKKKHKLPNDVFSSLICYARGEVTFRYTKIRINCIEFPKSTYIFKWFVVCCHACLAECMLVMLVQKR